MTDSAADDPDAFRSSLPDGWQRWSQGDDGRLVLAYRPDVFDAEAFPPACLPTLYLTHGKRTRRPRVNPTSRADDDDWYVTLYLEPDVDADTDRFATREDALERVLELARAFDAGEVDYRGLYQVPRETYFERLDELTGADDGEATTDSR
ncbi:DUF5820 family protein [Natronolimnohabitans innermongolicus]|uniref:Uncharacterized protein n=1 Tax=Natronolimnohabitans innermongolicus JCM 12255 TaxID=1227499 RepID=L9XKI2_9EURY|nr:DUF5820 family protein [Natronolimnohabitans innermongolicus]ELY62289.1 hypothetical protein C493_00645 [Natronolimnohabitans innermongolicus JCM 12255]